MPIHFDIISQLYIADVTKTRVEKIKEAVREDYAEIAKKKFSGC